MNFGLHDLTRSLSPDAEPTHVNISDVKADPVLSALLTHHHLLLPFLRAQGSSQSSDVLKPYIRRQVRIEQARGALCHLSDSSGFSFRWIKGVPLAQKLFGDGITRYSGDIDILVRPQSFCEVCHCLLESGWSLPAAKERDARDFIARRLSRWNKDVLLVSPGGIKVEVHHRLSITPSDVYSAYENWLWSDKTSSGNVGPGLECLELFYLVSHGSATAFHRLKWLFDIAVYLGKLRAHWGMSDDRFAEAMILCARGYGVTRRLVVSWALCHHFFDTFLPDSISGLIERDRMAGWLTSLVIYFSQRPSNMTRWHYRCWRRMSSLILEERFSRRLLLSREYLHNGFGNAFLLR